MIKNCIVIGCDAFKSEFTRWSDNTFTERAVFFKNGEVDYILEKEYTSLTEWKEAIQRTAEITIMYID